MKQTFYLVSVLLVYSDYETSDKRLLFTDFYDAIKAQETEIKEYTLYLLESVVTEDTQTFFLMVDNDGYSLTIVVEEIHQQ
ncbi:hypothetical protein [Bacteroides caecimuris]|uniref:hypothetical protein n=1 Tax=Bacteroides caecimuris TaxID=1796613 RepID=UPI0026E58803|nr:hypothetical protein [Bacteroides caecimuris]